MSVETHIEKVLNNIKECSPGQEEFYQAVHEVLYSLVPLLEEEEKYDIHNILERITVPERTIIFRINWIDDNGKIQTNLGYRVQFNSAIGPYKGGLRFHPSVNLGIINLTFNQREQAKMGFQEALRINPREETALINLAFLAQQENNTALAEKCYKDILSIDSENSEVLLAYASLLEKNSRFAEALSCYQKSLEMPTVIDNEQLYGRVRDRIDLLRYYYSPQR